MMLAKSRINLLHRLIRSQFKMCSKSHYSKEAMAIELETKEIVERIFLSAVDSVLPQKLLKKIIKVERDRLIVGSKSYDLKNNLHMVGFGKAVLGMAVGAEKILGRNLISGTICIPENTLETFKCCEDFQLDPETVIKVYEGASGNIPDFNAACGAQAIIDKICSLNDTDIVLVLLSGGGSALLPKPRCGITLEDKMNTIKLLAAAGASIKELNTVRKALSEVKGGGLAVLTYPRTTITLILSDVVNDPLDIIASGPTVPNEDKPGRAFQVLEKFKLVDQVSEVIVQTSKKSFKEPCIPINFNGFSHVSNLIIGNNAIALQQAKFTAESLGFRTVLLSNVIESSIDSICEFYSKMSFELCKFLSLNDVGTFNEEMASLFKNCYYNFAPSLIDDFLEFVKLRGFYKGICILAGGETTVKVKGTGVGGRNLELTLMMARKLHTFKQSYSQFFRQIDVSFFSGGTDGIDGSSPAAGAFGTAHLIHRAVENYIDPGCYLQNNDSYNFFKLADNGSHLLCTGHTGTNVMDIHIITIRDLKCPEKS